MQNWTNRTKVFTHSHRRQGQNNDDELKQQPNKMNRMKKMKKKMIEKQSNIKKHPRIARIIVVHITCCAKDVLWQYNTINTTMFNKDGDIHIIII